MKEPVWILDEIVQAVHLVLLAEHGGRSGIRDSSLLESALARAKQKFSYEPKVTLYDIAAAYSFGIAKNHLFIDGNKRTAFTIGALFLEINGLLLEAPEPESALVFENLADGAMGENDLASWFKDHSRKP